MRMRASTCSIGSVEITKRYQQIPEYLVPIPILVSVSVQHYHFPSQKGVNFSNTDKQLYMSTGTHDGDLFPSLSLCRDAPETKWPPCA